MSLARKNRLTRENNFLRIKKNGEKIVSHGLVCYICSSGCGVSRLAVVASSKSGIACKRNRLKRCLRETFRLNMEYFVRNADIIVYAQKVAVSSDNHIKTREYFLDILKKSKVLN